MFKNILIVSDNSSLCNQVHTLSQNDEFNDRDFTFSISPFSDPEDFIYANQIIRIFNLKDETVIDEIITEFDLVISIHCKQIFPKKLVESVKCINVHPGYNPINRGWYPQVFAIINDLPIGATIHEIDVLLDHGNIIARKFVNKSEQDTSLSLYNKIVQAEIELLKTNFTNILNNTYSVEKPEGEGNLFLKKDFNNLCKLNMEETGTMRTLVNKLRALTHGEYKNAYFIDTETNEKVYLSLQFDTVN